MYGRWRGWSFLRNQRPKSAADLTGKQSPESLRLLNDYTAWAATTIGSSLPTFGGDVISLVVIPKENELKHARGRQFAALSVS
jgi:hypothetical protein